MNGVQEIFLQLIVSLGLPFVGFVFFLEGALIGKLLPTDFILPVAAVIYPDLFYQYFLLILFSSFCSTAGQFYLFKIVNKKGNVEDLKNRRFIKIPDNKIEKGERYFKKFEETSVFVSNLLPFVRGTITIPAAINDMRTFKFAGFSFMGNFIYHSGLVVLGLGIVSIPGLF